MAFHLACPITCKRICFCTLGFPEKLRSEKGKSSFLDEISRVGEFLTVDPWSLGPGERRTVQISVPRVAVDGYGGGDGEELESAQAKRAVLQRMAAVASLAAEELVRKLEAGGLKDASGEAVQDHEGEDHASSTSKVMCRMCFSGESEGSNRAMRMLSCRLCNKKYHRKCLKSWAAFRDLFHWSSWVCPSCRICEVCRRAGDPNRFMFCKRCDDAYHCYCQQPPHKKITSGPFLCPKHTRCHGCGSAVSGSGFSTRWWLGYTFCDACGRLFAKGKYCPVCLKVYRDSESTPMVCCDVCQHWVHCQCDGISNEKYLQFQTDRNLHYKCAACRGDSYQVSDIDDAVEEIWRRRDEADSNQIVSLRAAAGLPSEEEIFSISPYSDDDENDLVMVKSDYGRPFRFCVKGLVEKATKNNKENDKKSGKTAKKQIKKKGYQVPFIGKTEAPQQNSEGLNEAQLLENGLEDKGTNNMKSYGTKGSEILSPHITRSSVNYNDNSLEQTVLMDHSFIEDKDSKVGIVSSSKSHGLELEERNGKRISKTETVKGRKLVIHLAARNRHTSNSPWSETSTCPKDRDFVAASNGVKFESVTRFKSLKRGKTSSLMKLGKVKNSSKAPELNTKTIGGNVTKELESSAVENTSVLPGRTERVTTLAEPMAEATSRNEEVSLRKYAKRTFISLPGESHDSRLSPSVPASLLKDPKPLLKLKFKKPYFESQLSWATQSQEEKNSVKGQRSKRKRPSPLPGEVLFREDESGQTHGENSIDEDMDANWILKKLGKDAIGKRVEVHQSSDDTWYKGTVFDMIEDMSSMSVHFDDGRSRTMELGKQGVRLISQKQKHDGT
eukprot:TRINITY_DN5198_c0_g2_i5.p1 TRINITY_DN5198_c0_g2~~TRINITY_DN5198_c0_g2_i5.p1  ORF type:complete len:839 (-),score=164.74 TRINITY_DN5198_c0_g2_i5:613-3129(-)